MMLTVKPFTPEKVAIERPSMLETIDLAGQDVSRLKIDVTGSNLCIEGTDDSTVGLSVLWREGFELPTFTQRGNTLYLTSSNWRVFKGQTHAFAYNLTVPRALHTEARMKAGVISIDGMSGDMSLRIAIGGSIEVRASSRRIEAHLRAGDVRLFGIKPGKVRAHTFLGDAVIDCDTVEAGADISVSTKAGDVKALFPPGFDPHYEGGEIHNAVGAYCKASAFLGDVKVGERSTGATDESLP